MSKEISLEILDYEGTKLISSALGGFSTLYSIIATSGDSSASPPTTPEPEAIVSQHPTTNQWKGWYCDGTGSFYWVTPAPYVTNFKLHLPTSAQVSGYSAWRSACGVYILLKNLQVGQIYVVNLHISQVGSGAQKALQIGHAMNLNVAGGAIVQSNGQTIYPAFGISGGAAQFNTAGAHYHYFHAAHTSGYFSISGYGQLVGEWIVDSLTIAPLSSAGAVKSSVVGSLDLTDSETFPLAISYTVSDGKDLESRFGDFSKTFNIPATKSNNKLLSHIYNPLIKDDNRISGLKDCRIMVDNITFFTGQVQIKGSTQTSRPESYSATIYGGNFSWVSLLRDKGLCDLQLGTSAHTYDYPTIESSWTKTPSNSNIIYPLVSYGDFYPTGMAGSVNLWDEEELSQDWRGWFWVFNILKQIFTDIGYEISSGLIGSATFKKLICHFDWLNKGEDIARQKEIYRCEIEYTRGRKIGGVPSCTSNPYIVRPSAVSCLEFAYPGSGTGWVSTSGGFSALTYDVVYDDAIHNPIGAYDTSTGDWTCPKSGWYKITAGINVMTNREYSSTNNNSSWRFYCRYHIRKNGTNIVSAWVTSSGGQLHFWGNQNYGDGLAQGLSPLSPAQTNGFQYFAINDVVDTRVEGWGSEETALHPDVAFAIPGRGTNGYSLGASTLWNPPTIKFEVEFDPEQVSIGDDFLPQEMLPCTTTQIDFIKSISHMFNLYFYTDVQRKIVYIEPFNDFFTHRDAVDWTEKVDLAKETEDNYDIGLTQEVVFKYKEDSKDAYLEYLNEDENGHKFKNPLYSYYETLGADYKKGLTEFENPLFAPTQQTWDNDLETGTAGALIPVIWGAVPPSLTTGYDSATTSPIERPDKIWDYEPRIAYYQGYIDNPNNANYITKWNKSTGVSTVVWGVQQTPRATFVDWEDPTFPSLSYGDEMVNPPFSTTNNLVEGLYTTYWRNMIEQLKTNPRIRKVSVNLKIKDILNLDMRKLVYLDGSWWRINKVVDFSPAKDETTQVELIQWFEV